MYQNFSYYTIVILLITVNSIYGAVRSEADVTRFSSKIWDDETQPCKNTLNLSGRTKILVLDHCCNVNMIYRTYASFFSGQPDFRFPSLKIATKNFFDENTVVCGQVRVVTMSSPYKLEFLNINSGEDAKQVLPWLTVDGLRGELKISIDTESDKEAKMKPVFGEQIISGALVGDSFPSTPGLQVKISIVGDDNLYSVLPHASLEVSLDDFLTNIGVKPENKPYPLDFNIKGPIEGVWSQQYWTVFIDGSSFSNHQSTSSSLFYSGSEAFLYCQYNAEDGLGPKCSLNTMAKPENFWSYLTTIDMANNYFGGDMKTDFRSHVLQRSKVKIGIFLSKQVEDKIGSLSEISYQTFDTSHSANQDGVFAGTYVRYIKNKFPHLYVVNGNMKSATISYIVNILIESNSVTATTVPHFSISMDVLYRIVLHQPLLDALSTSNGYYGIVLENMKYSGTQTCATFSSLEGMNHEFVKGHFIFQNTVVTICGDEHMATISAKGKEKVLGADASVEAKLLTEFYSNDPAATSVSNKGWLLTGKVKIFDIGYVLEKTRKQFMSADEVLFFPNLKKISLTDTVFKAPSTSQLYLILSGKAEIYQKKFDFELVSRSEEGPENPPGLALCLMKTGGTTDDLFSVFYKKMYKEIPYSFESSVVSITQEENFYSTHEIRGTGVVLRCQTTEKKHREIGEEFTGRLTGSMRVMLSVLVFECNNGQNNKLSPCTVIKNGFGGQDKLQAVYYGSISKTSLKLGAKINKPFIIADGIEISSDDLRHILVQDISTQSLNRLSNTITGTITLGTVNSRVTVTFEDESAIFKMESRNYIRLYLYGVSGISVSNLYRNPVAMSSNRWPFLELHGSVSLGTVRNAGFDLKAQFDGDVQQFFYSDQSRNKFFVCAAPGKEFSLSKILNAFNARGNGNMYQSMVLKEVCVAYHNEAKVWEIETHGLKAKQGLRLYGTVDTMFGANQLDVNVRLDGDVTVFIELPLLKFGGKTNSNYQTGASKTRYPFIMSKTNLAEDFGPTFSTKLNTQMNALTGYIRLPLFEAHVAVSFDESGSIFQTFHLIDSEIKNPKIEKGTITLHGNLELGPSMGLSQFNIIVDLLDAAEDHLQASCKKEFSAINERSTLEMNALETQYTSILAEINTLEGKMLTFNGAGLKRTIQDLESEMLLDIKKAKKKNIENCKSLKLSGFKLEKSCGKRNSLQNATCLKFKNDAFDAVDTICLEKSRKIRKEAHEAALKKNKAIRATALTLRERRTCHSLFQDMVNHYKNARDFLNTAKTTDLPAKITHLQSLGDHFNIIIAQFRQARPMYLTDIPYPFCINFAVSYVMGHDGYQEIKLCVDEAIFDVVGKKLVQGYINTMERERDQIFNQAVNSANKEKHMGDFLKRKHRDDYKKCRRVKRAAKREKVFVPELFRAEYKNQAFYTNSEQTKSMLQYFAPWNVMKRNNPMSLMSNLKPNRDIGGKNINGSGPCSDARNQIEKYGTMVDYMKTWVENYQQGVANFKKVNENIARGLQKLNMTQHSGYAEFTKETQSQLNQLNAFAPSYMKNEINALINPQPQNQLENYLSQTAFKANSLIKKSFSQNDDTISNLSNMLIQQFSTNKTLEQMAPSVQQMEKMMISINKRSLVCHDEL